MGVIGPIKDLKKLELMKEILRENSTRDYLIFRIGINLGLTVQELLEIKVKDILEKEEFVLRGCRVRISPSLQREIKEYVGSRDREFLFQSRKGDHISRFQLYGILRNVAKDAGFEGSVGAMILRKTFAYWAYHNKLIYLPLLSKYLKHHTVSYTLRYIDVEETSRSHEIALAALDL